MAARTSTRVNRKYKTKYRVANWREYERGIAEAGGKDRVQPIEPDG